MLKQLIHRGVIVPPMPAFLGLSIAIKGKTWPLNHAQEEMALAWARKKDTPYVDDPVFQANFGADFCAALGVSPALKIEDLDFSAYEAVVDAEREQKANQSQEDRKALAAERRIERERLKAEYGFALVNGQRVELGTYLVEPSGIFMGRGQHPLRGRWKAGAKHEDITLNLSPDAPRPEGNWEEIVWQPESLWVARWKDKLTDKLKYIWFSDTAPIKQEREARKFDKALKLEHSLDKVRARIREGLAAEEPSERMLATACYLIDALCLRVGDEKEADEADTVGATTLRPEHITINDDGTVDFAFLGKDSVAWRKTLTPPRQVVDNLEYLRAHARPSREAVDGELNATRDLPQLFPDVTSRTVNAFLSGIMPGLSAKVFRTFHATMAVKQSLETSGVERDDPEYKKWHAASVANLQAAVLCNHTKQYNGNWARSQETFLQRQATARERIAKAKQQAQEHRAKLAEVRAEAKEKIAAAKGTKRYKATRERYTKRRETAAERVTSASERATRAEIALGKIKAQYQMADQKRTWNLGTSLKSYIDPRVYHAWGQSVDYDVLDKYYTSSLRRKYIWVRSLDNGELDAAEDVAIRTCMPSDLVAVSHLLELVAEAHPTLGALASGPEQIAHDYLPTLDQSWREAFLALGDEEQVAAFVVIGPTYAEDQALYLDLLCLIRPDQDGDLLAPLLAAEIETRVEAFQVNQPRKMQYTLRPKEGAWIDQARGVAELLELLPDLDEDAEDDDEDEHDLDVQNDEVDEDQDE